LKPMSGVLKPGGRALWPLQVEGLIFQWEEEEVMVRLHLVIDATEMDILLASVRSSRGFVRLLLVSLILVQGTFPARMDPTASSSIFPAVADICMTVLHPMVE